MKTQKILLDIAKEEHDINLGLVRLVKEIPDHELFYHINALNTFNFYRISDLVLSGTYYDHYFPRFETFHCDSKICLHFIANRPVSFVEKKPATELFSGEDESRFLLRHSPDVDYVIKTSEPFDEFSLILHPENLMFKIQDFVLSPFEELYQTFQYYE